MDSRNFQRVLDIYFEADVPLHVWGAGGIGKSQIIEAVAERKGHHMEDLRLATQEVGDLIGIPKRTTQEALRISGHDEEGNAIIETYTADVTTWTQPTWFRRIWNKYALGFRTVLFLDEMDRANKEVIQVAYQLTTKKQLHEHELPPGTIIIAAGNPPTEDYMVETFDDAMCTRWAHVKLDANVPAWLTEVGPRMDEEITGFIATAGKEYLFHKAAAWDIETVRMPTPRGWEFVNRGYGAWKKHGGGDQLLLMTCVGSIVGAAAGREFVQSLETQWITRDQILSGAKNYQDLKASSAASGQILRLVNECSLYLEKKDFKSKKKEKMVVDASKVQAFGAFLDALTQDKTELSVSLTKSIMKREREVLKLILTKVSPSTRSRYNELFTLSHKVNASY